MRRYHQVRIDFPENYVNVQEKLNIWHNKSPISIRDAMIIWCGTNIGDRQSISNTNGKWGVDVGYIESDYKTIFSFRDKDDLLWFKMVWL